ncbi:MAG: M23 family metallopeptidase [Limnochordia bacterium]|nr:M23 family metallopeptidase [Limnochordia bacterium]
MKRLISYLCLIALLSLSGCLLPDLNMVPGEDGNVDPPFEQSVPGRLISDGFDYPVGGGTAQGFGVTGYGFLQWSNYSQTWHPGEDWNYLWGSSYGKAVLAVSNGTVKESVWNTAQGNIIRIEHTLPDGRRIWSQYAHLAERWVKEGDLVYQGQQIGTIGGGPNNKFVPHLHFELRRADLPSWAWPRLNGVPYTKSQALEYWIDPSSFIEEHRRLP